MWSLVAFTLGDREYALDIAHVQQVIRMVAVTPLPDAVPGLLGAINVHGTPTPVIDLRQRFGLPSLPPTSASPLLLVTIEPVLIAALVDRVNGVVKADTPLDAMGMVRLGERLIAVLEPTSLLTPQMQGMLLGSSDSTVRMRV
jgi:purine-binding chemotaxis protein CheW